MNVHAQPDEFARTLNNLGGAAVIARPIESRLDVHDALAAGLPAAVLVHLVKSVPWLGGELMEPALGISLRTYQRWRDRPDHPLSPEQSGRAWKFAEILARTTELFGSKELAEEWLRQPAMALNQRRPLDLLATPAGVEALEEHLTRMDYGVYT